MKSCSCAFHRSMVFATGRRSEWAGTHCWALGGFGLMSKIPSKSLRRLRAAVGPLVFRIPRPTVKPWTRIENTTTKKVRNGIAPFECAVTHLSGPMIVATLSQRADNTIGVARLPATSHPRSLGSTRTSRPIKRKRTSYRIPSTSSRNVSTCSRVFSVMANARPRLPVNSPETTTAISADGCNASTKA